MSYPYGQYGAGQWVRCHCGHSFHIGPKEVEGKSCMKCARVHRIDKHGNHLYGEADAITSEEVEDFSDKLHWDHILPVDF